MAEESKPQVQAVLGEIQGALLRLKATGESWTIFINKMGLSQEERQSLRDSLGQGNVTIKLGGSAEPAEWLEAGVSGVWYGVFYDQSQNPMLETIEVAFFPPIAAVQPEDLVQGLAQVQAMVGQT
jgi:hydrogenase-1 operon protein HyaF